MVHVGRKTGLERRTPLGACPVDGGFVFLINYDSKKTDWVLNIISAGESSLLFEGETYELTNPRVISRTAAEQLTDGALKAPPNWMNVEFLEMDLVA